MYILQRFFMESIDSYVFFSTLTYDDAHLPTLTVNDHVIRYADFSHFVNMVKRIRKNNLFGRPFRYYAVSERGKARSRPHFHCLWFLPKYESDTGVTPYNLESIVYNTVLSQWCVNISPDNFKPIYEPLFTFHSKLRGRILYKNFDTHYVKPVLGSCNESSVVFYCMKYMLKGSIHDRRLQQALKLNLSPSEYSEIWNKVRSKSQFSKHFGFGYNKVSSNKPSIKVLSYIKDCIKRTPLGKGYPFFFSPIDGKSFPLAPYYSSKAIFYSFEDALPILLNSESPIYTELSSDYYQRYKADFELMQRRLSMLDSHSNPTLID